jgi:hypothetical protein
MQKFNRYKVSATELPDLMSNEKGFRPMTENDWAEFLKIVEKGKQYISKNQINQLRDYVFMAIDSENPPLSALSKKHIYQHYAYARFGASKVSKGGKTPIQLDKGEVAEPDAIKWLSKIDGVEYHKNEKLFQNSFFKGIPDIVLYENEKIVGVKEIKVPVDLITFFERFDGNELIDDRWQMLAYLDILGLKSGEICYILVDMPENVRKARIRDAEEKYISFGYTPDHIKKLIKNIERSMTYNYIPDDKRIVRFEVSRKGYFTTQMHKRVKLVRERMANLHEKFENGLFLAESIEPSPPENIS